MSYYETIKSFFIIKPVCVLILCVLFAISAWAQATPVVLKYHHQRITLIPETLKISQGNILMNAPALKVDQQPQSAIAQKQSAPNRAGWTLKPAMIRVEATLTDTLSLKFMFPSTPKIQRNQPVRLQWFRLPAQQTSTLYLPFSEGMRVPVRHPAWARFLTRNYSGSNTTQDLKMPFWTARQGNTFISYQLITPTQNQLTFSNPASTLEMQASHHFTPLNQQQPFEVQISQGKDALDGARQYRRWRITQGLAQPLTEKIRHTPQIRQMIGASQTYLFGNDLLSVSDVVNWAGFTHWYLTQSGLKVPGETQKEIPPASRRLNHYQKQLLIDSVNGSLIQQYPAPAPTLANNGIAAQYHAAQQRKAWLARHAGQYLLPPQQWGQALTTKMLNRLKTAGIKRLWIGFENWMPAFYQPEVVEQAKQAGYLVATYDSYNTAIPRGRNDDWLTAQFPEAIRQQCAIETASGTLQKGFKGQGYYLDPACHRDYIRQRIQDILHYGHFNSLFLDVDATAMTRENYRTHAQESAMLEALNHRMNRVTDNTHVVLGSEDGNSLTTRGLVFAHGMESIGFGWTDPEMKQKRHSPYYLGRWYPEYKPEFFFQSAQVKKPYKTLLFAPQYRIPLYQTVFHDEVINSQHWHTDNLKFSDVKIQRDLIGMLYNTPPMVHLTRDEVTSATSPRIRALKHYQDGYLPVHQQLWDQQLTGFQWLDTQGQIQQTTFSDGSQIIANFTAKPFHHKEVTIQPHSILARLKGHSPFRWTAGPTARK